VERCVLDTFPLPVCENVRAPRCRLAPGLTYRGYIPSKRAYFHGLKLRLVCNNHPFITEVLCTPGSVAAVQGLYLLPLDLAQGSDMKSFKYAHLSSSYHIGVASKGQPSEISCKVG